MEIEKLIFEVFDSLIKSRGKKKDNWGGRGRYLPIKKLNNDDTGEIGELLLNNIFSSNGYKVEFEKSVTSEVKDWDIVIDDIKIEVKTATIGSSADTFQHEKFFKNRKYDAICLLDFTPNELYMTLAREDDIVWEALHARKVNKVLTTEFKFDLSLSIIKKGVTPKFKNCFVSLINTEQDMMNLFDKFKVFFDNQKVK